MHLQEEHLLQDDHQQQQVVCLAISKCGLRCKVQLLWHENVCAELSCNVLEV